MSVRVKALLMLASSIVGLVAVCWLLLDGVVRERFERLERAAVQRDVDRVLQALDREAASLDATVADWAEWDSAFEYLLQGGEAFEHTNFTPGTLRILDLCSLAFLDAQGRLRFGMHRHGAVSEVGTLPPSHQAVISRALVASGTKAFKGVVVVDGTAHLLAARPVTRSDGSGPSPGFVVMLKSLQPDLMARLAAGLDLRAELVTAAPAAATPGPGAGTARITPVDADTIVGAAPLPLLLGDARLDVVVRGDRALSREGAAVARYVTLGLLGILIVFGLGLEYLLDRTVLRRLGQVEAATRQIAIATGSGGFIEEGGRDEVGRLVASINTMLAATRDMLIQISRSIREVLWIRERASGRFTYVSPGYEHIWGRSCESLHADPASLLQGVHPDDREVVVGAMRADAPLATRVVEFRVVRHDGSVRWVTAREFPLEGDGGDRGRLLGLVEDITEGKEMEQQSRRLEAQLRRLARGIDEAREEERRKLAVWLHDEVGQLLTALRLDLAWLEKRLPPRHPELVARLGEMQSLLEARLSAVQRISIELRPSILEDLGLRAALDHAREQFVKRTGLPVELSMTMDEHDVAPPVALALLRITQEALTNIARHAAATRVAVTVRREGNRVQLTVTDDGRGIRPDEATGFQALGILGMRERTVALGGSLDVHARPEGGSELVATMLMRRVNEP